MNVAISGILCGFRVSSTKDGDVAEIDVLQPGSKDFKSSLTHIFVDDLESIEQFLNYSKNGIMRWCDLVIVQVPQGKTSEIWVLRKIIGIYDEVRI